MGFFTSGQAKRIPHTNTKASRTLEPSQAIWSSTPSHSYTLRQCSPIPTNARQYLPILANCSQRLLKKIFSPPLRIISIYCTLVACCFSSVMLLCNKLPDAAKTSYTEHNKGACYGRSSFSFGQYPRLERCYVSWNNGARLGTSLSWRFWQ